MWATPACSSYMMAYGEETRRTFHDLLKSLCSTLHHLVDFENLNTLRCKHVKKSGYKLCMCLEGKHYFYSVVSTPRGCPPWIFVVWVALAYCRLQRVWLLPQSKELQKFLARSFKQRRARLRGHYTGKRPSCVACATGKFLRSPLGAQGKQNSHLGCSEVVHRRFQHRNERQWAPWSPQSFEHAQNTRRVVAEVCDRSKVAQRWQKEGTRIGAGADWAHSGRSMNAMRFACQSVRCFCLSCASLLTPNASSPSSKNMVCHSRHVAKAQELGSWWNHHQATASVRIRWISGSQTSSQLRPPTPHQMNL